MHDFPRGFRPFRFHHHWFQPQSDQTHKSDHSDHSEQMNACTLELPSTCITCRFNERDNSKQIPSSKCSSWKIVNLSLSRKIAFILPICILLTSNEWRTAGRQVCVSGTAAILRSWQTGVTLCIREQVITVCRHVMLGKGKKWIAFRNGLLVRESWCPPKWIWGQ